MSDCCAVPLETGSGPPGVPSGTHGVADPTRYLLGGGWLRWSALLEPLPPEALEMTISLAAKFLLGPSAHHASHSIPPGRPRWTSTGSG